MRMTVLARFTPQGLHDCAGAPQTIRPLLAVYDDTEPVTLSALAVGHLEASLLPTSDWAVATRSPDTGSMVLRPHLQLRGASRVDVDVVPLVGLCRDEDCPRCGYPETRALVDPVTVGAEGPVAIGCTSPRCDWLSPALGVDVAQAPVVAV